MFCASALARTVDHRIPVVLVDGGIGTIGLVDIAFRELRMKTLGEALGVALEPSLVIVPRCLFDCLEVVRREIQISAHQILMRGACSEFGGSQMLAAGWPPD